MIRIALRSLFHDRTKLIASVAGVTFAAVLVLVQLGLFGGFLHTSSSTIARLGGDVWVMPRGTEVIDSVETLSAGTRSLVAAHPCVARARPLVFAWAFVRKAAGTRDTVRVVGFERGSSPVVPWSLAEGLPSDLHAPMRVAIDAFDVKKLQISGPALGASLEVGGQSAKVAAVTKGVRSFTLLPFIFAQIDDARRMAGFNEGETNFWILDLHDGACAADVIRTIERHPELQALPREVFLTKSQDYWVVGSGIGAVLSFTALLALIVGVVVVGQTLFTITKDYHRELATLKALGARDAELVGFVAWQAAFLALVGCVGGLVLAFAIRASAVDAGLVLVLSPKIVATSLLTIVAMCALASLLSVRRVLRLDPAEVFQ